MEHNTIRMPPARRGGGWRPVVALLAVVALAAATAAQPGAKPADGAAKDGELGGGYTRVDLTWTRFYQPSVAGECGGRKVSVLVDSGAPLTIVDRRVAEALKLKLSDEEVEVRSPFGKDATKARVCRLPPLSLGGVAVAPLKVLVTDLSQAGLPDPPDVLLGHDVLELYSAVLDCGNAALHLAPPEKTEWPRLAGEWTCVSRERDGRAADKPEVALAFADGRLTFTFGRDTQRFRVLFYRHMLPRMLVLAPETLRDDEVGDAAGAVYAIYEPAGGRLKFCLTAEWEDGKPFVPQKLIEFVAPVKSGLWNCVFERAGKPPAGSAELTAAWEKAVAGLGTRLTAGGFTRVPLARPASRHHFSVPVGGGKNVPHLIVDTGANRTVVYTRDAGRFGLKPPPDDEAASVEVSDWAIGGVPLGSQKVFLRERRAAAEGGGEKLTGSDRPAGLLGMDVLRKRKAVIDYATGHLYLK